MAQRKVLRSLAATAVLPVPSIHLAHAKEARPIPLRAGDRTGDARQATIGAAVPEEAIVYDGDAVGGALPFAHQDGPAARKRRGQSCRGPFGLIASEHLFKQSIQFSEHLLGQTALAAFLSRIRNSERENVPTQRSRRLIPELPGPE